jgi:eukaryotic-like serine/threonine-protein kinase
MPAAQQQVGLPPRYRVVRHIANGGMAAVWAAEDELLERLVAVKVLAPGYAADPSARRRFTREARAAARVSDHPHVVTIFDIVEHEGQAFIVMEHFPGGTVADRLKRGEPVPVPTALEWLEQTASALDAAHAADIVHRDVKPGNLLLDERGRVAVGDFGIASIAGDTSMTQAGQVLGTAAYLSPEQARGNPATPASDRYSLAVVAYELLCGKRPFGGETPAAQARAHVEVDPPTPAGPCESAADVLKRGLAKDPAERPPTAAAFVSGLRDALGGLATPARADEPPTTRFDRTRTTKAAPAAAAVPRPAPTEPPRRRPPEPVARRRPDSRRWLPLALLAMLCLVVGAAAALITDNGNGGSGDRATTTPRTTPAASKPKPKQKPKATTTQPAATTPATTTAPATSTPAQTTPPAAATAGKSPRQLNDEGFAMLPGDAAGAVPLLQAAVDGFRRDGSKGDVNYAYALYNLGWALRLSGRPAEAIPYLEERLQISDYKRGVVEKELRTARQQAGQPGGGKPKKGAKKGD